MPERYGPVVWVLAVIGVVFLVLIILSATDFI